MEKPHLRHGHGLLHGTADALGNRQGAVSLNTCTAASQHVDCPGLGLFAACLPGNEGRTWAWLGLTAGPRPGLAVPDHSRHLDAA